jgi:hypothetical protein
MDHKEHSTANRKNTPMGMGRLSIGSGTSSDAPIRKLLLSKVAATPA